ncbi:MAG: hypothetical protein R6U91_09005 [Bacillota bacterium]
MKRELKLIPVLFIILGGFFTAGFSDEPADEDRFFDEGFTKEQEVGTEGGTTKRHIDLSNPWSGAYLYEDMEIEGKAEIKESFSMGDVDSGANVEAATGEESGTKGASVEAEHQPGEAKNTKTESDDNPGKSANDNDAVKYELNPGSLPGWNDLF